jgi:hypothetical protein
MRVQKENREPTKFMLEGDEMVVAECASCWMRKSFHESRTGHASESVLVNVHRREWLQAARRRQLLNSRHQRWLGQMLPLLTRYVLETSASILSHLWLLQSKPMEIRLSNMVAAKGDSHRRIVLDHRNLSSYLAISDAVRTSLGPRGMDKMVCSSQVILQQGPFIFHRSKQPREK